MTFEADFKAGHLTRLYLIHPFYRKDAPNSSVGSREDAGACSHPGGTKEKAACYWSDPRQSWEISVGLWAGYVCGGKKQQKAQADINNATVSLASHWSDGEVSFKQNHTTCLFKLVCAHSHFFKIDPQPETAWHSAFLSKKMHVLVDDTNVLSQPDGTVEGATQTQEPGSHQARGVTHNLVRPPGLSCLYTSAGSGSKEDSRMKRGPW